MGVATIQQRTRNKEQELELSPRRKGDDIAERLLDVAVLALAVTSQLNRSRAPSHIAKQLARSVTSAGANFEEARGAESHADFVHKLRVAAKEMREAKYWMTLVERMSYVAAGTMVPLIDEADQLVAILTASAKTAKSRGA